MKNVILVHGYNGIPKIYKWLESELKKIEYNVIIPEFPPREGVVYKNWSNIFDQYREYINSNTIIVTHSIGNEFIIKYLNENELKINLYISLAGFSDYFEVKDREDLNRADKEFLVSKNEIQRFKSMSKKRYCIYSDNDHIVPLEVLEKHPININAIPILIRNIGHMGKKSGLEKIPEVIEIIKENQ